MTRRADDQDQTVATYNRAAQEYAEYFRSIESLRKKDADIAFALCPNKKNPKVVEIGCADGRDAEYIAELTDNYHGFDPAAEFIKLAKQNVPKAKFTVDDANIFDYPQNLDIVFAFASLIHLDKSQLGAVFDKIHNSLKSGGIFYISFKTSNRYRTLIKKDKHGERLFYIYSLGDMERLAGNRFKIRNVAYGFVTNGQTEWIEIALQKC